MATLREKQPGERRLSLTNPCASWAW